MTTECVACGAALTKLVGGLYDNRFGAPGFYSVCRCVSCRLDQTQPRPGEVELRDLYASYYNFSGESGTRYIRWRERFLMSPLYRAWMAIDGDVSFHGIRGQGRLIDIGCNEGRGLALYQRNGFDPEGLEINPIAAECARRRGFVVYEETLETFEPTERYDVAILSNVLEHSLNPQDMLRQASRVLSRGGELWISCPNGNSWWRRIFGRNWINWHVPFHIVHFDESNLKAMLHEAGFEVVKVKNATPSLWVSMSVIATFFSQPTRPTRALRNPILVLGLLAAIRGLLFPFLVVSNVAGGGDCLLVTAKRL